MVLSILNPKGGTGKTTLTTNLARALQARGEVLLLDLDPQQSAQEWAERNPDDYPGVLGIQHGTLLRMVSRLQHRFPFVLLDGAAIMDQRTLTDAIKVSDVVLIPVQPSGLDIWGTADLVELIRLRQDRMGGKPRAAFVISRQIGGTRFAADVQGRLEQLGLPVFTSRLTQRIAFAEAVTAGQSVLDCCPGSKAAQEITALTHELWRFVDAQH